MIFKELSERASGLNYQIVNHQEDELNIQLSKIVRIQTGGVMFVNGRPVNNARIGELELKIFVRDGGCIVESPNVDLINVTTELYFKNVMVTGIAYAFQKQEPDLNTESLFQEIIKNEQILTRGASGPQFSGGFF